MVECTALEMRRALTGTVGSNPTLSAITFLTDRDPTTFWTSIHDRKTNLTRRLGRLSKSDANRLAAPVIQQFHDLITRARSGAPDETPPVSTATHAPAIAPITSPSASSPKLMTLFDGYLGERQPSPATIKR